MLKLCDYHLGLLREVQWQGGVLFAKAEVDEDVHYRKLVTAGYLFAEPANEGGHRYELSIQGLELLRGRHGGRRKKGSAISAKTADMSHEVG